MILKDTFINADRSFSEQTEFAGTITLDPNKSITLTFNNVNMVVSGKLVSKPVLPNVHTFRFTGINEAKFVGEGMEVLPTDIGMWVMGSGQLDLDGPERMGWTRPLAPIKAGDISFTAEDPTGWQVGDEIVVMPTAPGTSNYDERVIKKIDGKLVTVDKPLTDHSQVKGYPLCEIANLTRNIRIEGTANGRSHMFIHSTVVQNLTAVAFRYMGPRKTQQGMANSLVVGRYAIHFHHCEEGSRGSGVDCCVVRDSGSHSFVPHGSHGITFEQCVGYNVLEDCYWYDLNHSTHDLTYLACLAAKISFVPRSLDMDLYAIDTTDKVPILGANGWLLGRGDGNSIRGCVAVGSSGDPHAKAGFMWPTRSETQPEGVWDNQGNLSHNCNCGSLTWQNTGLNHTVEDFLAYSNGQDMFHGAYSNNYVYRRMKANGLVEIKSGSGDRLRFIDSEFNTVNLLGSALDSDYPMQFINCKWANWVDGVGESVHGADLINCEGPVANVGLATEIVRVQPKSGQAYKLTRSGKTNIPNFAPSLWGTGTGLKAEYFSDPNFTNKVFERIDPVIAQTDWGNLVHHLITTTKFSVRWTGKLQAQFTESHNFIMGGGGNMTLWINGAKTTKANLVAGQFYDIKCEFFNNDDNVRGGALLMWSSPSILLSSPKGEIIPLTQLYPSAPAPPSNKPPVANAGTDQVITLPTNSVVLNGTGSDSDGIITAYKWTGKGTITDADKPVCRVSGLVEGDNIFSLLVTDDKGATGTDTVTVTVKPLPVPPTNQPPTLTVSAVVNVVKRGTIFLSGEGKDPEGGKLTYLWKQTSGALVTIMDPTNSFTSVEGFGGDYKFVLRVTDDKGAFVEKEVTATI